MSLSQADKAKILAVHHVGPKMVEYLELIGIQNVADLADYQAAELRFMINAELGHNHINALGERMLDDIIKIASTNIS